MSPDSFDSQLFVRRGLWLVKPGTVSMWYLCSSKLNIFSLWSFHFQIKEAKVSERRTSLPMTLVASSYGWSGNMERSMKAQAYMHKLKIQNRVSYHMDFLFLVQYLHYNVQSCCQIFESARLGQEFLLILFNMQDDSWMAYMVLVLIKVISRVRFST